MKAIAVFACVAVAVLATLTALAPSPSAAADASAGMTTPQVLDRMADALGGRDALLAARTVHLSYTGKVYGLDGTLDQWVSSEGRVHTHVSLGGIFEVHTVLDRDHGWLLDQNGKLSDLGGEDLEQEITGAYDLTWSALVGGRVSGTATLDGVDGETGNLIVRCQPDGGKSITYIVDPTTFLPVRAETPVGDRTQTVTLGEWKAFDGIMMPTHVVQSRGDPQYDATFDLTGAEINATPPEGIFEKPAEAASEVTFTDGSPVRDIPIELNSVHVMVQVRVRGVGANGEDSRPLWFVLDSGAGITVFNTDVARDLGLELKGKVEGRGAGKESVDVNLIPDVSLSLPGVVLDGQTVAALPLGPIEARVGRNVDGILGFDFISRFVVEIDYHDLTMSLYDRNAFDYHGDGSVVPIVLVGSNPMVTATFAAPGRDPVSGTFLVDTGAGASVIFTRPYAESHDLAPAFKKSFEFVGGLGVGGESRSTVARLASLTVGSLAFESPTCALSHDEGGALADPNMAGLIGGLVLSRCNVFFDYEHKRMILERNADFDAPFEIDWSGLILTTGGRGDFHTFTVVRALDGSPASDAGIREGDVITSADGTPASELTMHTLWLKFQHAGNTVQLTISRDGKEKKAALKLKRRV